MGLEIDMSLCRDDERAALYLRRHKPLFSAKPPGRDAIIAAAMRPAGHSATCAQQPPFLFLLADVIYDDKQEPIAAAPRIFSPPISRGPIYATPLEMILVAVEMPLFCCHAACRRPRCSATNAAR